MVFGTSTWWSDPVITGLLGAMLGVLIRHWLGRNEAEVTEEEAHDPSLWDEESPHSQALSALHQHQIFLQLWDEQTFANDEARSRFLDEHLLPNLRQLAKTLTSHPELLEPDEEEAAATLWSHLLRWETRACFASTDHLPPIEELLPPALVEALGEVALSTVAISQA